MKMFKIKVIRKDYNTQIAKKIYEGTKKFTKYGSDYYKRKHNTNNNAQFIQDFNQFVTNYLIKLDSIDTTDQEAYQTRAQLLNDSWLMEHLDRWRNLI